MLYLYIQKKQEPITMRMIKTNNIILKTEIGDKCRETITNEKTDGVHLSF